MILHCPPFLVSNFAYIGSKITVSQSNGFINNVYGGLYEEHSVLTGSFSPSNADITANFSFIFQIPNNDVGYAVVEYGLINTVNNDVNNPNDFIVFQLTATKENPGAISQYNPLAIDIRIITKNFGIVYEYPRYYCNTANFNEVGIIFELSNIVNNQCDISIQYVDNHRWESFNEIINSFNVSSSYQWHMHFNDQNIAVYQQDSYLLMNVATPLILPSVNSNLLINPFILSQGNPLLIELPSITENLQIGDIVLSESIFYIYLPSITSSLNISALQLIATQNYNADSYTETTQDLGDFFIDNNFGLQLTSEERDLKTDNTLITAILTTLGSNLSITQEEKILYGVDTRNGWYAETVFDYPIGWKGWLIQHLKVNHITTIKKWLLEAFQWLIDDKIVIKIEVIVQVIDYDNYYFQLKFYRKNENENYRFVYNWEKKNLERR